ncbi:hypothetical protein ACFE04_005681 [Oxalis oulophora]
MGKHNKRRRHHHERHASSSSKQQQPIKRPHLSPPPPPPPKKTQPTFISYLQTPNLPPKIKLFCQIISTTPPETLESILNSTGITITQSDVEQVLKLSYSHPTACVKFFRWAGRYQLNDNHTPYAWNLIVDLLGKNAHFAAMWGAVKSMKDLGLLSLATFASIFSSYVIANSVKEAIRTFEVIQQYGVPCDIIALNSFISAICRDGKTVDAVNFYKVVKDSIRPDRDTFAILLEGWENDGNVDCARETFAEMVAEIGWDPSNVPAYDSFLCTLIGNRDGVKEAIQCMEAMEGRRCSPGLKFFKFALEDCSKKNDYRGAKLIWDKMVGRFGFRPDAQLYHVMIGLNCLNNETDIALSLLDEMVYRGAFPESETYQLLFRFLIKSRKLKEATRLFKEMVKNEFVLSHANCCSAIRVFLTAGEGYNAMKIWNSMIENYDADLDECGNVLVLGLIDLELIQEAVKYADRMIERGVRLDSFSFSKLRQSLSKIKKQSLYEDLLRKKWKV